MIAIPPSNIIKITGHENVASTMTESCQLNQATSAGTRLAISGTRFGIKNKFLFKVTFLFYEDMASGGLNIGRDSTVAKFCQKYWTPHAVKLVKAVKASCQTC